MIQRPDMQTLNQTAIYLIRLIFALFLSMIAQALLDFQTFYKFPVEQAGLFMSFQSLGGVLFVLGGSLVFDRLDKRRVLLAAVLLLAIVVGLMSLLPSLVLMYLLLVLTGCSNGTIDSLSNAITGENLSGNRMLRFNLLHVFFAVGSISGPYFAVLLQKQMGIDGMLRVFAGLAAVLGMFFFLTLQKTTFDLPTAHHRDASRKHMIRLDRVSWLRLGQIAVLTFLVGSSTIIPLTWLSIYTTTRFGLSRDLGALTLSLYWSGRVAGLIIYPRLSRKKDSLRITGLGTILAGFLFAIGLLIDNPALYFFAVPATGLLFANTEPQILLLAIRYFPDNPAFATSFFAVVASFSVMIMPGAAGLISGWLGASSGLLMAAVFMILLGVLVLLVLNYRLGRRQ